MENTKCVDGSNDDSSSDSDVFTQSRKRAKCFIIDDSEEENEVRESCVSWDWQNVKNTPKIWEYSETHGIKASVSSNLSEDPGLLEVFSIIFDEKFWEILVTETNRFARQTMQDEGKKRKIDDTWQSVTLDEMKAYFALSILMAQVKKSNIQMYWSKRAVIETPIFAKVMSFKRFRQISRFLHFCNNETTDNNDRLRNIRPIINLWNDKFKEIYTPSQNVVIDESLMKYKELFAYKQFNPSKRARFGLKIYKLCEARTGFCLGFEIYTGQDKIDRNSSVSENVVMELSKSIINKGYTLFLDNWHSSPDLFLKLHQKKTNVIGTVRKDTKNKGMGAIDQQDQMLACFPIMRKVMKGYRKVFFYMSDMALFNNYIVYKTIHNQRNEGYVDFRINIAEAILKNVKLPEYKKCVRSAPSEEPLRLQAQHWAHFPKHIDSTPLKKKPTRACKVCTKHKKRSETTWECSKCKVALHLPECFQKYHTMEDY